MTQKEHDNIKSSNMELAVNHSYFVASLVALIDMTKTTSESLDKQSMSPKECKHHKLLEDNCEYILQSYRNKKLDEDESNFVPEFSPGEVIQKIYKSLKRSIPELKSKDSSLLQKRNEEGKIR